MAETSGCNPRLVREWLDGQAAGNLVRYDAQAGTYELPAEAAMALADDDSPVFMARGMNAFASMFLDKDKIAAAFKGDGGLAWGRARPVPVRRDRVVLQDRLSDIPSHRMVACA